MLSSFSRRLAGCVAALLVAVLGYSGTVSAKTVTDMAGRSVIVPASIRTIYAASPPETLLVYALDPTLLAGLNVPLKGRCDSLIDPHTLELPVIGGYFGQGKTPNLEMIVKLNPDIVVGRKSSALHEKFESFLTKFKIPIVYIIIDELRQYPEAFEVAGAMFNREPRAKLLADYTRQTIAQVQEKVASIPQEKRVRVYYAEDNDGLSTENSKSVHAELINLAGGFNVHREGVFSRYGKEKITLEKVIEYQPDVILAEQPMFYQKIFSSPAWENIPAVKNKRVYLIPTVPFGWFDRPPSFMRILGLKWIVDRLYPGLFAWDMQKETQEFFKLFLQKDITAEDARHLLNPGK